jgi:type IV pilus modification protein PilV
MTPRTEQGFTIVEVLIAIIMLSIGVLALSSSAGSVTRMMDSGRNRTTAAGLAQSVLDSLRGKAFNATPQCNGLANGNLGISPELGFATSWTVTRNGQAADITVTVVYQTGRAPKSESVTSTLYCRP